MKLFLALALAAALGLASAEAPEQQQQHSRQRRFVLVGYDVTAFFRHILERMHRTFLATRMLMERLFGATNHKPHMAREAVIHYAGSRTLVRFIDHLGRGNAKYPLFWNGHHLSWQGVPRHHSRRVRVDQRLRLYINGTAYSLPLGAFAHHLKHVPARKSIRAELLGDSAKDLRLVLHVQAHGHEDTARSVSILVHTLLQEHGSKAKQDDAKQGKKERMRWDGHTLSFRHNAHRTELLVRGTEDGVAHSVPLAVLAKHLQHEPAGSDVRLNVHGKKLHDLRVVLHVVEHQDGGKNRQKTISLPVSLLLKEAARAAEGHATGSHVQQIPVVKQVN